MPVGFSVRDTRRWPVTIEISLVKGGGCNSPPQKGIEMGNLGMSVMLGMLSGNEDTVNNHRGAMEKTIKEIYIDEDYRCDGALFMRFTDGTGIIIRDDGRSCCESRYLHTDDDLEYYIGAVFKRAELREAPNIDDEYSYHEVQFLLINTDKGVITLETHNEHNGYYGGFLIVIEQMKTKARSE